MVKLPQEPSDPKLKAAMEEIKAVLFKYDIAAVAILQSKTHGEWLNEITPSWSCAKMERDEKGREGIRFKATLQEYGSKEARNEAIRLTTGMLCGFRDGAIRVQENMEAVAGMVSQKVEIEHVSRFDR